MIQTAEICLDLLRVIEFPVIVTLNIVIVSLRYISLRNFFSQIF